MAYLRTMALPKLKEMTDAEAKELLNESMSILLPEVGKQLETAIKGTSEESLPEEEKAHLKENMTAVFGYYKGKRCKTVSFKGEVVRKAKKSGKDIKVRRNEIAAVLEYGRDDQPPKYFMRTAFSNKESEIQNAINKKFDEIIKEK